MNNKNVIVWSRPRQSYYLSTERLNSKVFSRRMKMGSDVDGVTSRQQSVPHASVSDAEGTAADGDRMGRWKFRRWRRTYPPSRVDILPQSATHVIGIA